jgi:hypothetical protein
VQIADCHAMSVNPSTGTPDERQPLATFPRSRAL